MILDEKEIEVRAASAVTFFRSGYNCSQSVFLAYADLFDIDRELAARLSSSFGGGMSRLREVCGTVTGMFMLAGLRYGQTDPSDTDSKKENYAQVQSLAGIFSDKFGSIVCRDLLALGKGKDDAQPSERTEQYYKKRPCIEYIEEAARIIGHKLIEETIASDR